MEDKELAVLLLKGDEKAFKEIVITYTPYVSAVIANQIGNFKSISVIEELSSDVFYELWRKKSSLKTCHLKGWLGATARNKAKNYIRKQKIIFESFEDDCISLSENNLSEQIEQKEQSLILQKALSFLNESEREIIVRYYYYNQTVTAISNEMNTNLQTVKSRLRRSREKLKAILEKENYR